ncbi:MAG: hypothetical protein J6A61_02860 [Clostridia bacterium]|nr:hypothetical protein [Clostridia bacterium]
MKKSVCLFFALLLLLSTGITTCAGSIPEDLLHSDDAQIFFAEVCYYHPDKAQPDIEVSPVHVIKGDVNVGGKLTFFNPNPIGDFRVKPGKVYLFTYFDENNPTDIFEAENRELTGIKLKHIEGDMWERFERNINDGTYFRAEQERRQKLDLPLLIDDPIAMGRLPFLDKPTDGIARNVCISVGVVFFVACFVVLLVKKKRHG